MALSSLLGDCEETMKIRSPHAARSRTRSAPAITVLQAGRGTVRRTPGTVPQGTAVDPFRTPAGWVYSLSATARQIRERFHMHQCTSAMLPAGRVILVSPQAWPDRRRSNRGGRTFAHREDYRRLTQ